MKLKKLILKKEIVLNLDVKEMDSLRGGELTTPTLNAYFCKGNSNNPMDCPSPYEPTFKPTVGPTEYTGHTAPPRCCEYGCCETVGC